MDRLEGQDTWVDGEKEVIDGGDVDLDVILDGLDKAVGMTDENYVSGAESSVKACTTEERQGPVKVPGSDEQGATRALAGPGDASTGEGEHPTASGSGALHAPPPQGPEGSTGGRPPGFTGPTGSLVEAAKKRGMWKEREGCSRC